MHFSAKYPSCVTMETQDKMAGHMRLICFVLLAMYVECLPSCKNGGQCVSVESGSECLCGADYYGSYCQYQYSGGSFLGESQ